ncbi:hypothetical protein EHP00_2697 [Ecytonucleospora hepatopenaei]|uniref:Eukaryotic translation initiation factor 6 n=1 Tax=Ecytonucleospora hepatopenaei TaxID=646526 RepID=A0A1W0E7W2_9MICR|nr:translation initiation factor 6 [Ecytonucleospora hepatopenaei]OQS55306.1 hypothetical protein EHP00_2697 [Ecytonucleospora hepatopenaei]
MLTKLDFEGNSEVKSFICLTNAYAIVGRAEHSNVVDFLKEKLSFPVVETTIANIKTVGNLCVGNKYGLACSETINDQELMHIRNSLPEEVMVARVYDKCNALGNNVLCNDHVCLVNPDFENTSALEEVLKVPVFKISLDDIKLVGSYACMNNKGMLVHPNMNTLQLKELSELCKVDVIASTINQGKNIVGSGIVANDFLAIAGRRSTFVELKTAGKVLQIGEGVEENVLIEDIVE